jgi:hypothetical protein
MPIPGASAWRRRCLATPSPGIVCGQRSRNQSIERRQRAYQRCQPVPYGAYFLPDPKTGALREPKPGTGSSTLTEQDYRPLFQLQDIYLTHGGYANYNSLQVAAQKQSGNLFLFTNFTFGKVLGTRDGSTSNGNGNGPVVNPIQPRIQLRSVGV